MDLRKIPEINEMMNKIDEIQGAEWEGHCTCKECYWNMWNPKSERYNNYRSMQCVSESLTELKMTPHSEHCEGYWSYEEACGRKKEETK